MSQTATSVKALSTLCPAKSSNIAWPLGEDVAILTPLHTDETDNRPLRMAKRLVKLAKGGFAKEASQHFTFFSVKVERLETLAELMAVLVAASKVGSVAIGGLPRRGTSLVRTRRSKAAFESSGAQWVAIDLDDLPNSPKDPEHAAELARTRLGKAFHGAECIWQASSGHALKSGEARLRLYFALDRPLMPDDFKFWLVGTKFSRAGIPVDPAGWGATQVSYLAVDVEGGVDPVKVRFGMLSGKEAVTVPQHVLDEQPKREARMAEWADNRAMLRAEILAVRKEENDANPELRAERAVAAAARQAKRQAYNERVLVEPDFARTDEGRAAHAAAAEPILTIAEYEDLADALSYVPPSESYPDWIRTLMALHSATNGSDQGLALANEWSLQSGKYTDGCVEAKWSTFTVNPDGGVGRATLFGKARDGGMPKGQKSSAAPNSFGVADDEDAPALSPRLRTHAQTCERELEIREHLVNDVLAEREIVVAAGAPNAGKTADLIHLGLCVAQGVPYHGHHVNQAGVLFAGNERQEEDQAREKMNTAHYDRPAGLPYWTLPGTVTLWSADGAPTKHEKEIIATANAMEGITGFSCKLIITDCLRRVLHGNSEKDDMAVERVMKAMERIVKATGASYILIAHTVRSGTRYSGSGMIESVTDSMWMYSANDKKTGGRVHFTKQRYSRMDTVSTYRFTSAVYGLGKDGSEKTVPVSVDDIAKLADKKTFGKTDDADVPDAAAPVVVGKKTKAPIAPVTPIPDLAPDRAKLMILAAQEFKGEAFSSSDLFAIVDGLRETAGLSKGNTTSHSTVRARLVATKILIEEGGGRARRYRLAAPADVPSVH